MSNVEKRQPLYVRMFHVEEVFGISQHLVYRAAQRGEIKIHKRGRASLLNVAEMEKWIEGAGEVG